MRFFYTKLNPFWVSVTHSYFLRPSQTIFFFQGCPAKPRRGRSAPMLQSRWLLCIDVDMHVAVRRPNLASVPLGRAAGMATGGVGGDSNRNLEKEKATALLSWSHSREVKTVVPETPSPPCSVSGPLVDPNENFRCPGLRVLEVTLCI